MSKVLNVFVKDYHDLHVKFPDKWAFVYDLAPGDGLFNGGTVYKIANTDAECTGFLKEFKKVFGDKYLCTILPTSPTEMNGTPYFDD